MTSPVELGGNIGCWSGTQGYKPGYRLGAETVTAGWTQGGTAERYVTFAHPANEIPSDGNANCLKFLIAL
jgi:hypothetical protein